VPPLEDIPGGFGTGDRREYSMSWNMIGKLWRCRLLKSGKHCKEVSSSSLWVLAKGRLSYTVPQSVVQNFVDKERKKFKMQYSSEKQRQEKWKTEAKSRLGCSPRRKIFRV
jgi:hypothetical protein